MNRQYLGVELDEDVYKNADSDSMKDTNIISITDIIENKVRKQKELEGYEAQLNDLRNKKFWIEKEIQWLSLLFKQFKAKLLHNNSLRL